jgi:ligand-binding SRPBCC domain-containing protein
MSVNTCNYTVLRAEIEGVAPRKVLMRVFHFAARLWLPRPRIEVFDFFSNASNLEEITPPWIKFQVVTPTPIRIQQGTEIDYWLKIRGLPVRWRSKIAEWDPPHRFVDEQLCGPYRKWIHEHRFSEESGGTLCEDSVTYAPLGGALINKLFVERDVRQIFAYRSDRLRVLFQGEEARTSCSQNTDEGDALCL